jgi:3-deoxy-D-manno-octulosonic-acid transferase
VPYFLNLCYLLLLLVALPWLLIQAVRSGKYREGYAAKFLGLVPRRSGSRKCIWFHAVSVGEVNLLAPLLRQIERERPDWECVISATTKTGMALAKKKYPGHAVFYCPLDFSWAVRTAMRRIRPDVLVLAELELWPNLIRAARAYGARVAIINGRLSEHSFQGYRRIRPLVARLLGQVDLLAVQDETYSARFRALGAPRDTIQVTGSMKYDGAQTDRRNPATQRLGNLAGFAADDVVFLAGSTQEPEESVALDVFRRLSLHWPNLRLVIVPRHPERFDSVAKLLDASGLPWQRRTALEDRGTWNVERRTNDDRCDGLRSTFHVPRSTAPSILLVDCVGELGAWWGTAHIAFVGGSLGNRGGQNMIEPAAYGAAVSFGPNTRNFRDIVATMLAHDAAAVVADGEELLQFVRRCLEDREYAASLGTRARTLVLQQLGATDRTFHLLDSLMPSSGESRVNRAA